MQPAVIKVVAVIQTDNELSSALEVLREENSKLKAQVAEKKKRSQRRSMCYSRKHNKESCLKKAGAKEVLCLLKVDIQSVSFGHITRGTDNGMIINEVCVYA